MATAALVTVYKNAVTATHSWTLGTSNTDGAPLNLPDFPDKTVTCTGTFNSEKCTMQGSADGTNWVTLRDVFSGVNIVFSAAGCYVIQQNHRYIRPLLSGGTGVTLLVSVTSAGSSK